MKLLVQQDFSQIPIKGLVPETGSTAPAEPVPFQLWGDTTTGRAKWYVPGAGWMALDDVADGAITNAKVPDGALSLSKLATDPLDRGNHTGTQPAATISDLATVVTAYKLNEFAAPAGPLDLGGQRATNAGAPTADGDLVTKAYLTAAIAQARAGIAGVKDPVRVVALTNVNLGEPGEEIDGVTMVEGDRFLAAAQTVGTENGIYTFNGPDTPATRAADADEAGEILDGTVVAVAEGTRQGYRYMQQATPSGAPGTWTQQWTADQAGSTSYDAAPLGGLQLTGNAFSVKLADSSLETGADGLKVKLVSVAQGGTGATTAAEARTNLAATGKYTGDAPALTAGNWTSITHNLGTTDVVVSVRENPTGEAVTIDWKPSDANTVQLRSDINVAAGALRVVVVG